MVSSTVIDRDTCVREIAAFLGWRIITHNITPQVEGKVPVGSDLPLHSNNSSAQYDLFNPQGQMVASVLYASDVTAVLPDWWNVTDLAFTLPIPSECEWTLKSPDQTNNTWLVDIYEKDYSRGTGINQRLSCALCLAWWAYQKGTK